MVTDATGRAQVKFRAPTALAEYRLTALGVTGSDTLVGQSTAGISVRKAFFVELKAPGVLTEGDEPRLLARLHHPGIGGQARVALKVGMDGRDEVFPKTVDLAAGGVTEILLDAFRVPGADRVKLTVSASAGPDAARVADEVAAEVPIRAWGMPVYATASGRSSDDATVFVALPQGRRYENPEMRIALAPAPTGCSSSWRWTTPGPGSASGPTWDARRPGRRSSAPATCWVRRRRWPRSAMPQGASPTPPRGSRPGSRNASPSWSSPRTRTGAGPGFPHPTGQGGGEHDLLATARVVWALTAAESLGLGAEPVVLDRSARFLEQALARLDAGEWTRRAVVLHALALRNKARFESVNALARDRAGMSDRALAYLAMTLTRLDHTAMAGEVLDVLAARARTESAGPGHPPRRYWSDGLTAPGPGAAVETTATVALAFARARPGAAEAAGARDWLLAHRLGNGWLPSEARGLVLQAIASAPNEDRGGEDRYHLVVTVNDAEVFRTEVRGSAPGREIAVPRAALKAGADNRVSFDIEGRGTFGYAVTLSGITRDFAAERGQRPAAPAATIRHGSTWRPRPSWMVGRWRPGSAR